MARIEGASRIIRSARIRQLLEHPGKYVPASQKMKKSEMAVLVTAVAETAFSRLLSITALLGRILMLLSFFSVIAIL